MSDEPTKETLADALPREIERCRELIKQYEDIGPVGTFARTMIDNDIKAAEKAMASGDLPAMIAAYKKLQGAE